MCSIIAVRGPKKEVGNLFNNSYYINRIQDMLDTKGGDEYKLVLTYGLCGYKEFIFGPEAESEYYNLNGVCQDLPLYLEELSKDLDIGVLLFSRLTPEMESESKALQQPYFNKDEGKWIMVHGTIPKAEEYNPNIEVDTEIFASGNIGKAVAYTEKVGGKISMLSFNFLTEVSTYENGLGMYSYVFNDGNIKLKNTFMFSNIDLPYDDVVACNTHEIIKVCRWPNSGYASYCEPKPKTRLISLFSGGLDITCSTYKTIEKNMGLESVDLWYFDWGTRAAKQEIEAGQAFAQSLNDQMFFNNHGVKSPSVKHEVIPVTDMFRNILGACDTTVRLNDADANGAGSHEAEAAISYVPFRNQFLLTLAAAKAEQLYPNDHCIFVLGANLSEGMVYLDNSETFVNLMNQVVKVGGQSCMNFEVVAPFVNRTKTDMVSTILNDGYDLSTVYSCYFPKEDGGPCGECGSCLLHDNALSRGNKGE